MSRVQRGYSLVPEELPGLVTTRRASIYDELLDEFMGSSMDAARMEYPGRSVNALMAGLRSRIKTRGLPIRVVLRKGQLYLTKN
ncbi:hypothetical protein MUP00_06760 [Candidatus Bathyarchaeota archaeon]|nr:hypothetical protein [Candidatus Bathyarchaeota archaeon]